MKKRNIIILIIISILIIVIIFFKNPLNKEADLKNEILEDPAPYNSNIMENVSYSSKDAKGNEYIVNATLGEIDYKKANKIYLTNVKAFIKLENSNDIEITSDFGSYDTINFDTIFSKNVIINYLDNKITGEYLDSSIDRNSMIISRNVVYTNFENVLKADVIEMDIDTKDTRIFMYKDTKKVNIKSK